MSNDTREALAARAKNAVWRVAVGSASVKAALDEIDRLAALTEQPAVPEHVRRICVPTETMEQEFQTHYRRGYEAGRRASVAVSGGSGIGASDLDITLSGDESGLLRTLIGDDEEPCPIRLLVGDGHSGRGLYVALAEYAGEGATLLCATPAAPQQAGDVEALRIQVRQADERGDEALRLAHAWEKVAVASGDWMPDAHGYPRWSASKARTAAPQGVQAEPPGFVLVPKEPTAEMLKAFWERYGAPDWLTEGYRAMLAAAPAAPAQEPQQPDVPVKQAAVLMKLIRAAWKGDPGIAEAYGNLLAERMDAEGLTGRYVRDMLAALRGERQEVLIHPAAASSPAPAVQPTEAVAELVGALRRARDVIKYCDIPVDTSIDRALAKHGQPQGGSNG